jgi:hypothetical protein
MLPQQWPDFVPRTHEVAMRFSSLKLRFSLRSLFLATLLTALLLQNRLSALQLERSQRREVLVMDIREQVIAAERIEPQYGRRMLDFVERRITKPSSLALLSPADQRHLLQLVHSAQSRIPLVLQPVAAPSANAPTMDQWAWSDTDACPW